MKQDKKLIKDLADSLEKMERLARAYLHSGIAANVFNFQTCELINSDIREAQALIIKAREKQP